MKNALVWFRNNLRLHDNQVLLSAAQTHRKLFPVYFFEKKAFSQLMFQGKMVNGARLIFQKESVAELKHSLREIGGDLACYYESPEKAIPQLCKDFGIDAVFTSFEPGTFEEAQLLAITKKCGVAVHIFTCDRLFDLKHLPFELAQLPDVFTSFRKEVEKECSVPKPLPKIEALELVDNFPSTDLPSDLAYQTDKRSAVPFNGGESAALNRLKSYVWTDSKIINYKETRNGLIGKDYSSKFSLWLANGSLSSRTLFHEIQRYEQEVIENESTYWMRFELLWREYFRWVYQKFKQNLFKAGGIKQKKPITKHNEALFEAWKLGNTGVPFVDAAMRELLATGYMSNRGRQNAASFLVNDLQQDWRKGAWWFEKLLIDYDVCSNYGNWNYVAGIGNDPRENRYFNPVVQAKRYDANAEFIKLWLPELQELIPKTAIAPWNLSSDENLNNYPRNPKVLGRFKL